MEQQKKTERSSIINFFLGNIMKIGVQIFFLIFAYENVEKWMERVEEYVYVVEKFGSSSIQIQW